MQLESIGRCMNFAPNDLYKETATTDIVGTNSSSSSNSSTSSTSTKSSSGSKASSGSSNSTGAASGNGAAALHMPSTAIAGVVAAAVAAVFVGFLVPIEGVECAFQALWDLRGVLGLGLESDWE